MAISTAANKHGSTAVNATATSWSVTKPAGVVDGDFVMVALSSTISNATITPPANAGSTVWFRVARLGTGAMTHEVWGKVASSEPASWTFGWSATCLGIAVVGAYAGVHQTSPVINGAANNDYNTSVASLTPPDVHTYVTDAWAVRIWCPQGNNGVNDPSLSPTATIRTEAANTGTARRIQLGDQTYTTPQLAGAAAATLASSTNGGAETIILCPDTATSLPATYYMTDTLVGGGNVHYSGSATQPAEAYFGGGTANAPTAAVGFNPGTNVATAWCYMDSGTEVARTVTGAPNWHTAASPTASDPSSTRGDSIVIGPLTRTCENQPFTVVLHAKPVSGSNGSYGKRFRLFRSDTAAGSNFVQIGSDADTNAGASTGTGSEQAFLANVAPGSQISFSGQYLLVQILHRQTVAGTGTTSDSDLKRGLSAVVLPPAIAAAATSFPIQQNCIQRALMRR